MTLRASIIRALKFSRYSMVDDHLKCGWVVLIPNAVMHHHSYGIELAFICDCRIPVIRK